MKKFKQCFERRSENVSIDYLNGFYADQIGTVLLLPRFAFLDFFKYFSWWLFSEGKGIYGYNESVRPDGKLLRGKLTTLDDNYFQVLGAPVLLER